MDRFTRPITKKRTIILVYHGFTDKPHDGIENYQGKHLDIKDFRKHLRHLKKFYNVIPLERFIKHCSEHSEPPANSVVITMDDGYQSNYRLAYPALKEFDMPATVFLATNFVNHKEPLWVDRIEYALARTKNKALKLRIGEDDVTFNLSDTGSKKICDAALRAALKSVTDPARDKVISDAEYILDERLAMNDALPEIYRPLNWSEVLEMQKSGLISIGSHTCSHVALAKCSDEQARRELSLSRQIIAEKTGAACDHFCYPNGAPGDFNARTKRLLKEAGYRCGLTNAAGLNGSNSDIFELWRDGMSRKTGLTEFKWILFGRRRWGRNIRRIVEWIRKKS